MKMTGKWLAGWLAAQSQNIYPPNFISQRLLALNADLQLSDRIRQTLFLNVSNMLKSVQGAEKQPFAPNQRNKSIKQKEVSHSP